VKNPLKTLYFDPALINLLRDQPALILKLAGQQRNFLQVVAHPDKMGSASTDYSAELNEAVDLLKDREQLGIWIEEYLQEITNADQIKRERSVLRTVNQNMADHIKQLETDKKNLENEILNFKREISDFERKKQEQTISWLMYRRPFTKIMVPDTRLFLPEIRNIIIEIGDEHSLCLYFMFNWQTVRILDGERRNVEKNLAKMHLCSPPEGSFLFSSKEVIVLFSSPLIDIVPQSTRINAWSWKGEILLNFSRFRFFVITSQSNNAHSSLFWAIRCFSDCSKKLSPFLLKKRQVQGKLRVAWI